MRVRSAIVAGAISIAGLSARGALLVYEPFTGYSASNMNGQAATGTGLSGNYAASGGGFTYTETGLNLGDLPVSGGAVSMNVTSGVTLGAGIDLGASSPVTGTLYSSYLFIKNANFSTDTNALVEMRVNDSVSGDGTTARFRSQVNSDVSGNNQAAIAYDSGAATSGTALGGNTTTYILIARMTNVGTAGSTGSARLYVLNGTQYTSYQYLADPLDPDAYLDSATVGGGSTQVTVRVTDSSASASTYNFLTGNAIQLAGLGSSGSSQRGTFDELRFGTTLLDVAPLPEPSVAAPLALGALALLRRRR